MPQMNSKASVVVKAIKTGTRSFSRFSLPAEFMLKKKLMGSLLRLRWHSLKVVPVTVLVLMFQDHFRSRAKTEQSCDHILRNYKIFWHYFRSGSRTKSGILGAFSSLFRVAEKKRKMMSQSAEVAAVRIATKNVRNIIRGKLPPIDDEAQWAPESSIFVTITQNVWFKHSVLFWWLLRR